MADFTPNYNLKKPLRTEYYNVADANGNSDIVDSQLKAVNDRVGVVEGDVVALELGKVDKVAGKQLSDENYTLIEKNKVANLPADTNAQLNDIANISTLTKNGLVHEYKEDVTSVIAEAPYNSGYWWGGVANPSATYVYTAKLPVEAGDVITASVGEIPQYLRFVQAYFGDTVVAGSSVSADTYSYVVPEGIDGLIVTLYSANQASKIVKKKSLVSKYGAKIDRKNFTFEISKPELTINTDLVAAKRIDNKKNCSYLFTGFFSSFGVLKIGHGKTEYGAVYITIDNTNIKTYSATGSVFQTFPHGLTLSDFIFVNIQVADSETARAKVTIRTRGGESVTENVIFFGCNGDIYANTTAPMFNVNFKYVVNDMKKDIYIFGDSYTSLADNTKFPHYLITNGYKNMLINGFGGATSLDAITAFNNIMAVQKPKYLVWLLGMNDADTTVINANWKSTVDTVIAYCENYDIEIILATIPNTPVVKNTLKNDYVRSSGYRYIDFAKAVNAEAEGAPWYTGMLSADNVHPTAEGAKALASRALIDVPEFTV